MKFEKKVIVGSIVSFIATAVGVVAVFFPDLLNLQKEKIKKLQIDILSQEDVVKMQKFLNDRVKDNGIFELDVCIPQEIPSKYFGYDTHLAEDEKLGDGEDIRIVISDGSYDGKLSSKDDGEGNAMICEDSSIVCYDIKKSHYAIDDHSMNRSRLGSSELCYGTLRGNFIFSKKISNPTFNLYGFKLLEEEQLRLKNY